MKNDDMKNKTNAELLISYESILFDMAHLPPLKATVTRYKRILSEVGRRLGMTAEEIKMVEEV